VMVGVALETERSLWSRAYEWLTMPMFTVGTSILSPASLIKFALFLVALVWVSIRLRRALRDRFLPRLQVDASAAETLGNMTGYTIIVLGLLVGLQTLGVKLSALHVVFGALGIGVGFGLQTIASNFVSGVIILMEKPIQIGDRVQLGELHGRVEKIKIRATEIVTNDNIAVIVPNSEFISQRVVNWSRGGNRIRVRVPVHVAYGSDPERVRQALLEATNRVDEVLKNPAPEVRLTRFGESSLDFELLGWTSEMLHRRGAFISRVNFAVLESLEKHGLEVPYPHRNVTLEWSSPEPAPVAASAVGAPRGARGD